MTMGDAGLSWVPLDLEMGDKGMNECGTEMSDRLPERSVCLVYGQGPPETGICSLDSGPILEARGGLWLCDGPTDMEVKEQHVNIL